MSASLAEVTSKSSETHTKIQFYLREDKSTFNGKTYYTILAYTGNNLSKWQQFCKFCAELFFFSKTTYKFDQLTFASIVRELPEGSIFIYNLTKVESRVCKQQIPFFTIFTPKDKKDDYFDVYNKTRGNDIRNEEL